MPVVGEAWYELSARDEKLLGALKRAEGQASSSGRKIEDALDGQGATAGFDKAAGRAGRFGGMLDTVKGKATGFGNVFGGLATGILQGVGIGAFMGVTAAAGALVQGIGSAITAASDLAETTSKVNVVFGPAAESVLAFGKDAAAGMGMSQNAALSAAGTFGNLFVAMGLIPDKSAEMSTELVKLAGDLASFNNVSPEEALEALRSGIVGEAEPLRRFGVQISAARVETKALELGLWDGKSALDASAKAQATYALILDDTKTAQGDFARTSTGLANQQRIASAKMEDGMARVGQSILPLANAIVPALSAALGGVLDWIAGILEGIGKWVGENKTLFDILGAIAGFIGTVFVAQLQTLGTVAGAVFGFIGDVIGNVAEFIKPVLQGIITVIRSIMDVAAQIPGPWQDATVMMRDALVQMEADAKHWGEATTETAAATGEAIPGAVADPIAAGASTVTDAAGTMMSGVAPAVETAKEKAWEAAKATPREVADSLREGQFDVKDAAESLKDVQKNALSKTKEIAKIEGFLTGDALKDALKSKKPGVRAEAEAWKAAAEERLWALKNGVPELAAKTGISYADALRKKRTEISTAAGKAIYDSVVNVGKSTKEKADDWGKNTGEAYGDGLRSSRSYITQAARHALGGANVVMKASSPPGPASPLHLVDVWAIRTARAYADAFAGEGRYLGNAVESFLAAAAPAAMTTWTPELRAQITPGSVTTAQDVRIVHRIEDPSGSLRKIGTTPGDVADAIVKGLDATGLFYSLSHVASMRGST